MVADAILTVQQPYPGDERYQYTALRPELRFVVIRKHSNDGYTIQDHLANSRVTVAQSLIEHPQFDLSQWYAKRRIQILNLRQRPTQNYAMGDAIGLVATKLLTDGIALAYPCTNLNLDPGTQFRVCASRSNSDEYSIDDADFSLRIYIPKAWLRNPLFNLVHWYKRYINQYGQFETCYLGKHSVHPDDRPEAWEEVTVEDGSESWEGIEPEDDPDMPELILVDDEDSSNVPGLVLADDEDNPDMPELVPVSDDDDMESWPDLIDVPLISSTSIVTTSSWVRPGCTSTKSAWGSILLVS